MKKLYFDCEFTGLVKDTSLISIGFISECGKTFYAEFTDYDKSKIDEWLEENVIKRLKFNDLPDSGIIIDSDPSNFEIKANKNSIAEHLKIWISQFGKIEIWSDCLSYDWVLFCDLFGGAMSVPEDIYYIPFDICTSFKEFGIDPDINREEFAYCKQDHKNKHNSLHDAIVIKDCDIKLNKIRTQRNINDG